MEQIDKLKAIVETAEEKKFEINNPESWMKKGFEKKQECSFFCLCGSHEYKTHQNNNGIYGSGFREWTTHYECSGCSIIFHDPKKYSEGQKKAKKRLMTAHIPI